MESNWPIRSYSFLLFIDFFFNFPNVTVVLFLICFSISYNTLRGISFLSLLVSWDKGHFHSALFLCEYTTLNKVEAYLNELYSFHVYANTSAEIVPLKMKQHSDYLMSLYQPWVLHAHISKHSPQRQYGRWQSSLLIVYWPISHLAFIDDANKTINLLTSLACHILFIFFLARKSHCPIPFSSSF